MPWPLIDILLTLPVFALVMFRLSGLMLTAPLYNSSVIPTRVRVALTFTLAAMIFPLVRHQAPQDLGFSVLLTAGVGEILIGVTVGLALNIMLTGAEVAGRLVGQQAGVGLANVFDPTRNARVSVISQVYMMGMMLLFLLAGGHRAAIAAILDTYEVVPLLSFRLDQSFVVLLSEMLASAFILGIRLAGPVLIALFLMGTALGFLSRTMPQLNILSVGFTLRALVGMGVAAVAFAETKDLLLDAIWDSLYAVREAFGLDPLQHHLVG